jgi:UDP-glucose 4-epimerase
VTELHELCRAAAGSDEQPRYEDARLGDVRRSVLDTTLGARELGWTAQVPLDDGLRRTWEWTVTQSR